MRETVIMWNNCPFSKWQTQCSHSRGISVCIKYKTQCHEVMSEDSNTDWKQCAKPRGKENARVLAYSRSNQQGKQNLAKDWTLWWTVDEMTWGRQDYKNPKTTLPMFTQKRTRLTAMNMWIWCKNVFHIKKCGHHVLSTKEKKDCLICYQCSVQEPVSLMVWGYINAYEIGIGNRKSEYAIINNI